MNTTIYTAYIDSPVGVLEIRTNDKAVLSLYFKDEKGKSSEKQPAIMQACIQQLDEYFAGKRTDFDLKTEQNGTPFQLSVWNALKTIPYGQTVSYAAIAKQINNPKAVRAVGTTNGKNAISIIIPCHRVIGNNGSLTGYGGGIGRKEKLLELERQYFSNR